MLSHAIPSMDSARAPSPPSLTSPGEAGWRVVGPRGSLPLPFHPSPRRQGPRLDPRAVPAGSGEGRLRGRLRLSVARSAGARLRGPEAVVRDRRAACDAAALVADPRRLRDRAARHERDPAHGRRGPGVARRAPQDGARTGRRGGVRWAGAQVSDLGAVALRGASRRVAPAPEDAQSRAGRRGDHP